MPTCLCPHSLTNNNRTLKPTSSLLSLLETVLIQLLLLLPTNFPPFFILFFKTLICHFPIGTLMASILGSQGVVLATAMAVSGTVILLALRLQKSLPGSPHQFPVIPQIDPQSSRRALRSCISSDGKRRSEEKKKKKRVHFAEDVVDPIGYSEEFRRQHGIIISTRTNKNSSSFDDSSSSRTSSSASNCSPKMKSTGGKVREMPANRMALYNGILRDRVGHRFACSY